VLRNEAAVGSDYISADQPVAGSGVTVRGFQIRGGFSTTTSAPTLFGSANPGAENLTFGMYFDTNICSNGGSQYGFAHNYSTAEPGDYFYYSLAYDNCPGTCYAVDVPSNPSGQALSGAQSPLPTITPPLPMNSHLYHDYIWQAWVQEAPSPECQSGVTCYQFVAQVLDPYPPGAQYYGIAYTPPGQSVVDGVASAQLSAMAALYGGGSGSLGAVRVSMVNQSNTSIPSPVPTAFTFVNMYTGQ
jgi:hypothetical protein